MCTNYRKILYTLIIDVGHNEPPNGPESLINRHPNLSKLDFPIKAFLNQLRCITEFAGSTVGCIG